MAYLIEVSTEPGHVLEKMTAGLTKHGIRTSCLGFGDHYDEEILSDIANATHGSFYDVKTEDNLPGIFKELEGLLESRFKIFKPR